MKKLILLLFFPLILGCEAKNDFDNIYQSIDLAPLRTKNTFSQPFRILKTKISDAALFDAKYGNTDLSIGYVLRYYFYTGIDLNADSSELISMNFQVFNLNDTKDALEISRDAIEEIRKMEFGSFEYEEFIGKYLSDCIDITKIQNDCIIPTIYEPVCGCDGFTYSNSAEAQCNGVLSFVNGKCN
jgi:hypothetical protein